MQKNGEVFCLNREEIMQIAEDNMERFIVFENINKGDIIDDGFVGFEAQRSSQVFECTNCQCKFESDGHRIEHKSTVTCPECGYTAVALNKKYGRKSMVRRANLVVFHTENHDSVWAECVAVKAEDFTDVYSPRYLTYERRALYHLTPNGGTKYKYNGTDKSGNIFYSPMKAKSGYVFYQGFGTTGCCAQYAEFFFDSAVKDSFLKYSRYEKYTYDHYDGQLLRYLMMYCEAPLFCELFTRICWDIVYQKIKYNTLPDGVNYKAKTADKLFRKLSKPQMKAFLKWLKEYEPGNMVQITGAMKYMRDHTADRFNKLAQLFGRGIAGAVEIIEITGQSPVTLSNYLNKQRATTIIYKDYIDQCKRLDYDLKDSSVLYPKNLEEKHRETSGLLKYTTNKAELEKSRKRGEKLRRNGFEYSHKRLIALVPDDSNAIIMEGAKMSHCVGMYANRHASGTTTIIFIRNKSDPETPFFTLEIEENTGNIRQCYGKGNKVSYKENLEVFQFLEHYQRHLEYCRKKHRKVRKTA